MDIEALCPECDCLILFKQTVQVSKLNVLALKDTGIVSCDIWCTTIHIIGLVPTVKNSLGSYIMQLKFGCTVHHPNQATTSFKRSTKIADKMRMTALWWVVEGFYKFKELMIVEFHVPILVRLSVHLLGRALLFRSGWLTRGAVCTVHFIGAPFKFLMHAWNIAMWQERSRLCFDVLLRQCESLAHEVVDQWQRIGTLEYDSLSDGLW
jgi:hypothetical protein